jgi:ZIP family zinc transporter
MAALNILILSTVAALGAGLGGALAVMRRPGRGIYGLLIGFACGIMLSVSFFELLGEAWEGVGHVLTVLAFGAGTATIFALDVTLPHIFFLPQERGKIDHSLRRAGLMTAVGVMLHNFPEGLAVAAGFLHSPSLGILMTIIIGLHNIPEGMAIAASLYGGGFSRLKSFKDSLLAGLAEPVGAMLSLAFLSAFEGLIFASLAFAAGVMIFLSLDELLPIAHRYGKEHYISIGLMAGLIASLLLSGTI